MHEYKGLMDYVLNIVMSFAWCRIGNQHAYWSEKFEIVFLQIYLKCAVLEQAVKSDHPDDLNNGME